VMFGRMLGPNCTVRVDQRECLTNPLFMEKDCKHHCDHLVFADVDPRGCARNARLCFAKGDTFENFVFKMQQNLPIPLPDHRGHPGAE